MYGIEHYFVFLTAGIMLNICPGPDTIYIIGRSVSQGRLAGAAAALGIGTGSVFHTMIGAVGLSALLLASANAFTIIKYAGAAYLLYQAYQMIKESFRKRSQDAAIPEHHDTKTLFAVYRQGALTNILNPKVALFFVALMPQFIDPDYPHKFFPFLILGLTFVTTGTLWMLFLALCAATFSRKMRSNSTASKWLLRINGCLFTGLAVKLASTHLQGQTSP